MNDSATNLSQGQIDQGSSVIESIRCENSSRTLVHEFAGDDKAIESTPTDAS